MLFKDYIKNEFYESTNLIEKNTFFIVSWLSLTDFPNFKWWEKTTNSALFFPELLTPVNPGFIMWSNKMLTFINHIRWSYCLYLWDNDGYLHCFVTRRGLLKLYLNGRIKLCLELVLIWKILYLLLLIVYESILAI